MGESKGGVSNPSQTEPATGRPTADPQHTIGERTEGKCGGENKQAQGKETMNNTGKCIAKAKDIPTLQIQAEGLRSHIQHMKDHALIGKTVGIWPSKKALLWWINVT